MGKIGNIKKKISEENIDTEKLKEILKKVKFRLKRLNGIIGFDINYGKSSYFDDKHINIEKLKNLEIQINKILEERGVLLKC